MDLKQLWRRPERIPPRFTTRRMVLRVTGFLVMCIALHHLVTSSELRHKFVPSIKFEEPQVDKTELPPQCLEEPRHRNGTEKATLLMLVRNRELEDALSSIRMIEDRFNRRYHYPWTFMNDEPFTEEFIKYTSGLVSGPAEHVVIPHENWEVPEHVNATAMNEEMARMESQQIIYGGSLSYRHMCRFNSGFFYNQECMKKYDWYWRVEPGTEFYCDVNYDPFTFMRNNKKVYGFVMSMYEFAATIPTLWERTWEFIEKNPEVVSANNSIDFLVDERGSNQYNLCHFWSNFEIASLEFYRSDTYTRYFEFLDSTGGFFYERWGDAPVHSLAVSLFAPKDSIHHFSDFGYSHSPCARCPQDEESHTSGRCRCNRDRHFDADGYSCLPKWWKIAGVGKGSKRD